LQTEIATCFEKAYNTHKNTPVLAYAVRVHAMECRNQLVASVRIINKLGQSAQSIENMIPDLRLAIEEGEPDLAQKFFETSHKWIRAVKDDAVTMLASNAQLQATVSQWVERVRACHTLRSKEIEDRTAKGEPFVDMSDAISKDLDLPNALPPSPCPLASTRAQLSEMSMESGVSAVSGVSSAMTGDSDRHSSVGSMQSVESLQLGSRQTPSGSVRDIIDAVYRSDADGAGVRLTCVLVD
jgi:hypothetical protein